MYARSFQKIMLATFASCKKYLAWKNAPCRKKRRLSFITRDHFFGTRCIITRRAAFAGLAFTATTSSFSYSTQIPWKATSKIWEIDLCDIEIDNTSASDTSVIMALIIL